MSGIPSWAVRGAKVVLVDDSPGRIDCWKHNKKRGEVFTLSEIRVEGGHVGCRVSEWHYDHFEYTDLRRFRPLVSTKTEAEDVALFRKHLTQNVPEAA